jgi:hypothetical protein
MHGLQDFNEIVCIVHEYIFPLMKKYTENMTEFDIAHPSCYFPSCYCVVISLCTIKISYNHLLSKPEVEKERNWRDRDLCV